MTTATVEAQLSEILADILAQSDAGPIPSSELEPTKTLAELGVNSVDLMEFVLRGEQQFDVDLLGNLTPQDLPATIQAWAAFVCQQKGDG